MDTIGYAADMMYGLFYSQVLSRLPEETAVRLGRRMLKSLPIEQLGVYDVEDSRLEVDLDGLRLHNPVILAACYHDEVILEKAMRMGFGAVVGKATRYPRKGNPGPRLARFGEGFINSDGYENQGADRLFEIYGKMKRPVPLGVSISEGSIGNYCYVIDRLDPVVDFMELNVSCANTDFGLDFSERPGMTRDLFREARRCTEKPLAVKLARGDRFRESNRAIVRNAVEEGIRVVDYGNTLPHIAPIGFRRKWGALSGPELFDDTLGEVRLMQSRFGDDIQIIATGGIDSPEKAYSLMKAGADAVAYVTGFITKGPLLARKINEFLSQKAEELEIDSIGMLKGAGRWIV